MTLESSQEKPQSKTKTKRFLRTICKVAGHEGNSVCSRCGHLPISRVVLNGRSLSSDKYYVAGKVVVLSEKPRMGSTVVIHIGLPTWVSQHTADGVRRGFKVQI